MPGTPSPAMPVDAAAAPCSWELSQEGSGRWGADLEGASEQTRQPRFTQRGTGQHRKRMRGSLRPRVHSCISGSQPDGKFSFWGGRTRAGPSVTGLFDLLPHSANSTVCSQTGLEMTGEPVSQVPRPSARQEAAVLSSSQVRPLSAVWSGLVWSVECPGQPRHLIRTQPALIVTGRQPSQGTF